MSSSRWISLALALGASCGDAGDAIDDVSLDGDADVSAVDVVVARDVPADAGDAVTDVSARDASADVAARDVPAPQDVPRDVSAPRDVAPDAPPGPVLYPADRLHAPITPSVAAGLRAIAARAATQPRVFAKVGASNTVNTHFVQCFGGSNVDLGTHTALRATVDHFRMGVAGSTDPYRRVSLAATVGWSAWAAVTGSPSPLRRELDAITPRYAVVMFGTNDIQTRDIHRHGQSLLDIADQCVARGVIPIFTSVPPRDDDATADLWVPRFTAVVRGVAQSRQVPFIDLERALRVLPGHGLGPDGIHMNALSSGARACALTPEGLRYGFNTRNLLTLESLDRVRRVIEGAQAPETTGETLAGEGTAARPFEVASLPFADARDTRRSASRTIDRYPGCMSAADESGPEFFYRLTVRESTPIRALVLSRDGSDVDVHLLRGAADGAQCVARNDRMITATLTPGTWLLSLDSFVSQGVERAGSYVLVVMRD
ncbi:MAG: SGNH/GDSL hydrolase family protein [Polyangiales bacterium]